MRKKPKQARPVTRGRPPLGRVPRTLVSLRMDSDLLAALRSIADARGISYGHLMHDMIEASVKIAGGGQ